jgi:hypothetical protein
VSRCPADARSKLEASLRLVRDPPSPSGAECRWQRLRFILEASRWMLIIYAYIDGEDRMATWTIPMQARRGRDGD